MATLIPVDGEPSVLRPRAPRGGCFTLEELNELIGGPIEVLPLRLLPHGGQVILIVHEEGRLRNLLLNPIATAFFQVHHPGTTTYIVGPAILAISPEEWNESIN